MVNHIRKSAFAGLALTFVVGVCPVQAMEPEEGFQASTPQAEKKRSIWGSSSSEDEATSRARTKLVRKILAHDHDSSDEEYQAYMAATQSVDSQSSSSDDDLGDCASDEDSGFHKVLRKKIKSLPRFESKPYRDVLKLEENQKARDYTPQRLPQVLVRTGVIERGPGQQPIIEVDVDINALKKAIAILPRAESEVFRNVLKLEKKKAREAGFTGQF